MDGIEVAHIATDGENTIEHLGAKSFAYTPQERQLLCDAMRDAAALRDRFDRPGTLADAEEMVTRRHAEAVDSFLSAAGLIACNIDIIGFHGQTVFHDPSAALTVQIGLGSDLARKTGIKVVSDLRANDMATGGQGAPLAPAYHRALSAKLPERPAAFVNIGGVSNVTWIGPDGDLLAFDTGPGNALLDDWAMRHLGKPVDLDGELARKGKPDEGALHDYMALEYFSQPVPKSLDRGDFTLVRLNHMDAATGAATLAHLTAATVIGSQAWFSAPPAVWVICGGGRKNRYLMELLAWYAQCPVIPAEAIGCNGDAIEAEAWAYLAVRSLNGLPITYPGTTGVRQPVTGGRLHHADATP